MHAKKFIKQNDLKSTIAKANNGDGQAMIELGIHYLYTFHYEDGTYEDFIQGINWLDTASRKNLVEAYYWLGCAIDINRSSSSGGPYYIRGIKELPLHSSLIKTIRDSSPENSIVRRFLNFEWGNKTDEEELYLLAAENGIAEAQFNLGRLLINSWINSSVYPDEEFNEETLGIARDWLCKSAEAGCSEAVYYLTSLLRDSVLQIRSLKNN